MTQETHEYFTVKEALEDIKNTLENGYDGYGAYLLPEVFQTDYYIIGTFGAKKALEHYGVFDAIEEIQDYEKNNFGQIHTELGNPEQVANSLYYLKGIEAIALINGNTDALEGNWNNKIDKECAEVLISVINELLK